MVSKLKYSANHQKTIVSDSFRVQENLAYTPSQMNHLREKGLPISTSMVASDFYDGDLGSSMAIDPVLTRGFDAIDAWELQQRSRSKILSAHKRDVEMYGVNVKSSE